MLNSPSHTAARAALIPVLALAWLLLSTATAQALSAPIHIAGTGGEGVYIRSGPSTSNSMVGWMPEGASPDYNCFAWGQNIGGVPIWFNVNYSGVTGYYASYYDDSSYHSNEELTAKYGVPLCGSASPTPAPAPSAPPTPAPIPAPPSGGSVYPVMNAAGGVYWRSGPDWNTPVAVSGNGFYEGTTVAVRCYQAGTSVPGSSDTMWEQASVVSGPGSGSGWINEHFIDDGAVINQPSPGVPACGGAPPATTAPPPAPPKPTEEVLVPDPAYWCVKVDEPRRFGLQIREADWIVLFTGVKGTIHQNDWTCSYLVQANLSDLGGNAAPLPPVPERFPIDFKAVCAEQFPGSRLQYELGPVYPSSSPWPWECIAPAGKYYPPPTLSISSLLGSGGFSASGVPASTAGHLDLRMVASRPAPNAATASSLDVLATGRRSVARAGRYSIAVRLTPLGRRLLRHAHRLRAKFTLRFAPKSGRPQKRSTHVTLRR